MARKNTWLWALLSTIVLAAIAVGGAYLLNEAQKPKTLPRDVVLVFAMPGEDQAVVAQLVVKVDTVEKTYTVADPNSSVPVPGTSYDRLKDAYPFGGAELVTTALLGDKAKNAGWVDVSPEAWRQLLASGFNVNLSEGFQAFNEATDHYSQFETGPQRVKVEDLEGFVNGAPYTQTPARVEAFSQLAAVSLKALSMNEEIGVESNFTDGLYVDLLSVLAVARPTAQ